MRVCVEDGWLKQPHLAESDWTLGLGEAERLLHIESSVCTGSTSHHCIAFPLWHYGHVSLTTNFTLSRLQHHHSASCVKS